MTFIEPSRREATAESRITGAVHIRNGDGYLAAGLAEMRDRSAGDCDFLDRIAGLLDVGEPSIAHDDQRALRTGSEIVHSAEGLLGSRRRIENDAAAGPSGSCSDRRIGEMASPCSRPTVLPIETEGPQATTVC